MNKQDADLYRLENGIRPPVLPMNMIPVSRAHMDAALTTSTGHVSVYDPGQIPEKPVQERKVDIAKDPASPGKKRRAPIIAAALLLIALLLGGIYFFFIADGDIFDTLAMSKNNTVLDMANDSSNKPEWSPTTPSSPGSPSESPVLYDSAESPSSQLSEQSSSSSLSDSPESLPMSAPESTPESATQSVPVVQPMLPSPVLTPLSGFSAEAYAICVYEGDYVNGIRSGAGIMQFANGDRYEGEWENGKFNGFGTYWFAGGAKYEGEWKDCLRHGQGTFLWESGAKYEGEWKDDSRDGYGAYWFSNGAVYVGEWSDNDFNGYGVYTSANRENISEGLWSDGVLMD